MADETKNQQQGSQTTTQQGQPGQGQKDQHSQEHGKEQGSQFGQQKNLDPNKKNPSTGGTGQNEEQEDQNRDRQRRAS